MGEGDAAGCVEIDFGFDDAGVLAEGVVLQVAKFHGKSVGFFLHRGLGKASRGDELFCGVRFLRSFENGRELGFVNVQGAFGVEVAHWASRDGYDVDGGFGFDDGVPEKRRGCIGEGGSAASGFAGVGAFEDKERGFAVQHSAQDEISNHHNEGDDGSYLAAWFFGFGADFVADEAEEFGDESSKGEQAEDPEVERWRPIESETF